MPQKVAILGASPSEDRYANMAQKLLLEKGHEVLPVSPRYDKIDGLSCFRDLKSLPRGVDTLTLYVNAQKSTELSDEILALKPARVIFNPGTENPVLAEKLQAAGIVAVEACTLVLLRLNRF